MSNRGYLSLIAATLMLVAGANLSPAQSGDKEARTIWRNSMNNGGNTTVTFTANPNPGGPLVGTTTLTWNAPGHSNLVIQLNSPTGNAMTGSLPSSGSIATGNWVTNGLQLFLVDASSGTSLASATVAAQGPASTFGMDNSMMTKSVHACQTPTPTTTFLTSDSKAYAWFAVHGASIGDVAVVQWYGPGGNLYSTATFPPLTSPGSFCLSDWIPIANQPPAAMPGAWQVVIEWNGSKVVTLPFTISSGGAAGLTDSNGMVRLTANGMTIPLQLADQDTGAPLAGVSVALGNDPAVRGSALVLIADPAGVHPLQLILLEGSSRRRIPSGVSASGLGRPVISPTGVAVSTGCPAGSGTTTSTAITVPRLPAPAGPPTVAGVQMQLVDALNALFSNPGAVPPGFYGPVNVQQYTATVPGDCLNDLSTLTQKLAQEGAVHYYLTLLGPVGEVLEGGATVVGLKDLSGDVISTFQSCWYQTGPPRTINITTVCFGTNCILIPQVAPLPTALPWPGFGVGVVVDPAGESLLTFENAGILGLSAVGNTDNTGTGTVQVPAGTNTMCADSRGYQKYTRSGFVVSSPETLDVTLTPIAGLAVTISPTSATVQTDGTQQFTATVTGSSNTAVTWSASAGTISGSGLYTAPLSVPPDTATVTATSVADTTKSASATVTITPQSNPAPLTFSVGELPDATVGLPYTYSFCTPTPDINGLCGVSGAINPSGGQPPYHFQLGTLGGFPPMGMYLNSNGLLTGTVKSAGSAGTASFTVCAVDLSATSVCQPVSLTVDPALNLTGTWSGNVSQSGEGCFYAGTMSWTLTETAEPGINLTGSLTYNQSLTAGNPDDCGTSSDLTDTLSGAVSGDQVILTGGNGETFAATVSATATGTTMTGTGEFTNITWSYSLTKQ